MPQSVTARLTSHAENALRQHNKWRQRFDRGTLTTRRQVSRYNAKSYQRACCRFEKAYFNFINHIIAYRHFNKHKILDLSIWFSKIPDLPRSRKIWRNLRANVEMACPLVTQNAYNVAKNGYISKAHEWNSTKVSTNNPKVLSYTLYKHTPIQKVERL